MSGRRLVLVLPGVRGRSPRTWFVGGSLVIHGAIAAVLLVVPSLRRSRVPLMDVPIVSLAGSLPTPAAPARAPSAPPSATIPARPEPVKPPEPKTPKLPAPDAIKKLEKEKPKPKEVQPEATPSVEPPPPAAQPPQPAGPIGGAPAAPPGAAAAGGITALDTGDPEFAWYRASVIAALRGRWTRPVIEDTQATITATVAFEIRRDGSVQNVRVETPSGVAVMDRSVLRAVIEAAPLPPLPPSWREPTLSARFEFQWRPGEPD